MWEKSLYFIFLKDCKQVKMHFWVGKAKRAVLPESILWVKDEQAHGYNEVHALAVADGRVVYAECQQHVLQVHDLT